MAEAAAARILLVEDTPSQAMTFAAHLERAGYKVSIAETGGLAREMIEAAPSGFDVILLDLQLPDTDGLAWLNACPEALSESRVIVVTANASINRAIEAMRLGAYDFLVKPVSPERLITSVRNAMEHQALVREVREVRSLAPRDHFQGFIGKSAPMQVVYRTIENLAQSKATVFITGESGVGKEVAAEAIHKSGRRKDQPFIAVNCGAIPENLLESELFGHVKGAFTGALDNRAGAAKEADGGTLFLDEICEMELKLQVKLLRFLQTGKIQRVGSSRAETVDVRVICATNRDPVREVAEGRFREDLYYRLAVLNLELPPLRERGEDVELLAEAMTQQFAQEEGKTINILSPEVRAMLCERFWPGNVRELQNTIRRAVVMAPGPELACDDFAPPVETRPSARPVLSLVTPLHPAPTVSEPIEEPEVEPSAEAAFSEMTLEEIERRVVEERIERLDGNVPRAARSLGVSPSTLYRMRERWARDGALSA
jgi:two-component system, repressor protein LuxO